MKKAIPIAVAGLLASGVASAADTLDKADTAWLLTSTALVLFMTLPGLALFYGGLVSRRNVLSVLMQCFAIAGIVTVLWIVVQYSLAFSDGGSMNKWVGGFGSAFLTGITVDSLSGTAPETIFLTFQLTFAIITCALIVGGFAERMRFAPMLLFSVLWSLIVYAPVCHWVWGGGWLSDMGFLDFAGGAVVPSDRGRGRAGDGAGAGAPFRVSAKAHAAAQSAVDGGQRRHALGGLVRLQRRQCFGRRRRRSNGLAGYSRGRVGRGPWAGWRWNGSGSASRACWAW